MISFHVDKNVWYTLRVVTILAVIFFFGATVARDLGTFLLEQDALEYIYTFIVPKSSPSAYQELPRDTIIYASNVEVLKKRDMLVHEGKDFLFADLNDLRLNLYRGGVLLHSSQILAKGKDESLFQTPSGHYTIHYKEKNHFSTIGKVWMPWSMHFFGNYFIHGWPYYPDGAAVAETFSGGCIRLSDEDAEELYTSVTVGMPVLVYSGVVPTPLEVTYFKKVEQGRVKEYPVVTLAGAALAADFETGQILFEKNADVVYPIASITKLMSALAAMETINRFKVLTITQDALDAHGESGGFLKGETFRTEDLLYPLILSSSNDVAELYEDESFGLIRAMNQKAEALGLMNTSFRDASGISTKNISTAKELFKLLQFLSTSKKPIFMLSGLKEYTMESLNKKKKHVWSNINWPLEDDRFMGGKSGKTPEAGETMAGVYRIRFPEFEERLIAVVVLQADNRVQEVNNILEHLTANFVYGAASLVQDGKGNTQPPVIRQGASIFEAVRSLGIVD